MLDIKYYIPIISKKYFIQTITSIRYQSSFNDDIFFDLTTDYNRTRFIHNV